MGDETKTEDAKTDAPARAAADDQPAERRDEDGLPLDRKPTLDDVRGTEGSGRATAVGCSVAVVLLLLLFWMLRAVVMR